MHITQPLAHSRCSINANGLTRVPPLPIPNPDVWAADGDRRLKAKGLSQWPSHQPLGLTSPRSCPDCTRAPLTRDSSEDGGAARATPHPLPTFVEHDCMSHSVLGSIEIVPQRIPGGQATSSSSCQGGRFPDKEWRARRKPVHFLSMLLIKIFSTESILCAKK